MYSYIVSCVENSEFRPLAAMLLVPDMDSAATVWIVACRICCMADPHPWSFE